MNFSRNTVPYLTIHVVLPPYATGLCVGHADEVHESVPNVITDREVPRCALHYPVASFNQISLKSSPAVGAQFGSIRSNNERALIHSPCGLVDLTLTLNTTSPLSQDDQRDVQSSNHHMLDFLFYSRLLHTTRIRTFTGAAF